MERWEIVLLSLGWFLVYEGFLPAFFPDSYREGLERVRQMDDKGLQIMGVVLMAMGLGIIWFI